VTPTNPIQPLPGPSELGTVSSTIVDQNGSPLVGAQISLSREAPSVALESMSGEDGKFSFSNLAPGPFQLTVSAAGFTTQRYSGILNPGENNVVPQITLAVATVISEVKVVYSQADLAETQIKGQERQRVLGVIPNFYVTYVPDAVPLTPKQKFELAWKASIDPVAFGMTGVIAGIQQSQNYFGGYGQGAEGYARRYGAAYGDFVIGTFIGGAILPSVLKQDPRYFYKGTGSWRSRFLYAVANSVICKGDNGRWQPAYSAILGGLAASGVSNLYYPPEDRDDGKLLLENTLIGIGTSAAFNILQEFVLRKVTPNTQNPAPATTP
jgi:hypothetical protein